MLIRPESAFEPYREEFLSGDAHLLLVVGEIATRYAVTYTTALDWALDYLDAELGRDGDR